MAFQAPILRPNLAAATTPGVRPLMSTFLTTAPWRKIERISPLPTRPFHDVSLASRPYSSLTPFGLNRFRHLPQVSPVSRIQQQRFLFGGPSYNILAQKEKTANNNPNSANAQASFYQALLQANMPAIIVERYRSGHFATNALTDSIYLKAMQSVGGDAAAGSALAGQNQNLNPEQLQAIGQAVAARNHHGEQIGLAAKQGGTGAKESPLYVVVEESLGSAVFRWVKFLFWFGFLTYMSLKHKVT